MKKCYRCNVVKEPSEFHKDNSRKDKLHPCCKECVHAYYEENREGKLAYQKENWDTLAVKQKSYRERNRETLAAKRRVYCKKNKARIAAQQAGYRRLCLYGLTPNDFKRMLAEQGGGCDICGDSGGEKGLFIDHCHKSGKVRALLCNACNTAIGFLKDSPALAQKALDYLKRHIPKDS